MIIPHAALLIGALSFNLFAVEEGKKKERPTYFEAGTVTSNDKANFVRLKVSAEGVTGEVQSVKFKVKNKEGKEEVKTLDLYRVKDDKKKNYLFAGEHVLGIVDNLAENRLSISDGVKLRPVIETGPNGEKVIVLWLDETKSTSNKNRKGDGKALNDDNRTHGQQNPD